MRVMTSNDAKIHFAKVVRWVEDTREIVFVRRYRERLVGVAPADWIERAIEAIGPPEPPTTDTPPPFPADPPAPDGSAPDS